MTWLKHPKYICTLFSAQVFEDCDGSFFVKGPHGVTYDGFHDVNQAKRFASSYGNDNG
mgnify:CR=1 FL=1